MANIKEAFEYAAKNPNSDFANNLKQLAAGQTLDAEAQKYGIDLTPFKQNAVSTPSEATKENNLSSKLTDTGKNTLNELKSNFKEGISGNKSIPSATLQNVGALGKGITNVVGDVISSTPLVKDVSEGAGSIIKKGIVDPLTWLTEKGLNTEIGKKLIASGAADQVAQILENNPDIAKNAKAIEDIANAILLARGGVQAASAAKSTLGKGAESISKVASKTSTGIKKTGEFLYKSAYTPSSQEAERILAYEASKPNTFSTLYGAGSLKGNPAFKPITVAETAQRAGIAGTEKQIGVQAKQVADTIYNKEISPAVKSIKKVISKEDLFSPLQERINGITDPSKKKAFEEAFDALKDDYNTRKSFTYPEAQKLKSELDKFTPTKVFKGKDVANEFRMLQHDIANTIRQKTYEELKDVNVRQKYIDYGNLQELQKVGVKAISNSGLKGGFGGFWSTIYDQAMIPVKTIGGKTLYHIGNKLEVIAPKKFSGRPLKDYLISIGYLTPQVVDKSISD